MTTSNGGRIVEHVDGVIGSSNERGVKLVGEDGYRNFSKYVETPIAPPSRGQSVRLGLDQSGFVRELELLGAAAAPIPAAPAARDRTITRLSVLKSAANFLGLMGQNREEVKSDHVLVLADKWLRWLEQEGEDDER
jgi:hypothetical protein